MTTAMTPGHRPARTREQVIALLPEAARHDLGLTFLVGVRGYFRDTMGVRGQNDIGVYDDAEFLVTPDEFRSFNSNTDPSREQKGMATLVPGVWTFKLGTHNASKDAALHPHYPALIQDAAFVVHRYGTNDMPKGDHPQYGHHLGEGLWRGWFGINNHKGSLTTTSSAGCQTIYPPQWPEFYHAVSSEMLRNGLRQIKYVLVEEPS